MSIVLIPAMVSEALKHCLDGFLVYSDETVHQVWFSADKVEEAGGQKEVVQKLPKHIIEQSLGKIQSVNTYSFGNEMVRMTLVLNYPETPVSFTCHMANELVKQCLHDLSVRVTN